jgi:hypothetical protein
MRSLTFGALISALVLGLGAQALSAQAVPPEALILSPEPGERVPANQVLVAVSFIDPAGTLDPATVSLRVSGLEVTAQAEVRGGVLTWRPSAPLPTGPQRAVVTARDRSGASIEAANWMFNVTEAVAQAALTTPSQSGLAGLRSVHGSIILEGAAQSTSGLGAPLSRNEEFLPRMWLNAGGFIKPGYRYSARFHLSGYESKDQQPVNRYRVDFRAPFFTVSGGDVNPVFHDLILSGRRVRGAQGEVVLGPLRLAAVGGETRRAIPGFVNPIDPAAVGRIGTFGQSLFAVRPAIGSGQHFQIGLTTMRVKDDVQSIPLLRTSPSASGSTQSVNPAPKDNVVAGLDVLLRLVGGRVMLSYENAASLLANDITTGPLTEAGLDSIMDAMGEERLGIDPSRFESFFTLNASLIPLDPRGMTNVAHQARGSVRLSTHLLSAEWRSIGGSYYTLGFPSLQRDLTGFRVSDSFTALADALALSVGYEQDQDNLDDTKLLTTTNTAGFLSASWQETPSSVLLTGSARIGARSNNLARGVDGAMDEHSKAISAGVAVPVDLLTGFTTRLSLNASMVDRDDPLNPQRGTKDMYYLAGFNGETDTRESTAALLFGLNQSELTGFTDEKTNLVRVVGAARHRLTTEWSVLADANYTKAASDDASTTGPRYNRLEGLGGAELEWRATTIVTLTGGMIKYSDERFPNRDTRELVARLRVSRTF